MNNQTRKFRINRKKWLNGSIGPNIKTYLWNSAHGAGCCLGHVVRQMTHCAWNKLDAKAWPTPHMQCKILGLSNSSVGDLSVHSTIWEIARINDKSSLTPEEREAQLKAKFKELNIEIEFYN